LAISAGTKDQFCQGYAYIFIHLYTHASDVIVTCFFFSTGPLNPFDQEMNGSLLR